MSNLRLSALLLAFSCCVPTSAQCPKNAAHCVTIVRRERNGTTTSTTFDNQARSQAVGDAVSTATESSLKYILVERPELQRIYNERMNRAEGRFTPLYEGLDLLTAIPVPRDPSTDHPATATLKHHRLGESWSQFLQAAPILAANVQKCGQEKRPSATAKRTKFIPCSTVWPLIDRPAGSSTFDCLSMDHTAGKDMLCRDFDGEAAFVEGKLSSLKVAISDTWSNVYAELCERFGPPNAADEAGSFAVWNTSDFHLIASNSTDAVGVSWMNEAHFRAASEWAEQVLASQNEITGGNSLDQ